MNNEHNKMIQFDTIFAHTHEHIKSAGKFAVFLDSHLTRNETHYLDLSLLMKVELHID